MRSSYNQSCRKDHHITSRTKRGGGGGNLGKSCDPGRMLCKESFPHPENTLRQLGDQPGQTGSFSGSEESAAGRTERNQHRQPWLPCCTSQPEMSTCWCGQPWVLNFRLQPTGPRKRTWLGYAGDSLKGLEYGATPGDVQRMGPRSSTEAPLSPSAKGRKCPSI